MKSYGYGHVPHVRDFELAYMRHIFDGGYSIRLAWGRDVRLAQRVPALQSKVYRCEELYVLVKALADAWRDGDEDAGDFANGILQTLGIEWIEGL